MTNEQLITLFGSKTRVKLLRHFLRDPGQKYFVRELTRLLNDHINAIRHELSNLESAGLVSKKKTQGKLFYRLNQSAPGMAELKGLFAEEVVPPPVEAPGFTPAPSMTPAAPQGSRAPQLGDVRLLIQNGKFVGSVEAPADLLLVGELDDELLKNYIEDLEDTHGEIRYTVMSEEEYSYRRQLFDRFITLMLTEPKKVVVNTLRDRQLARL
jgi:hypothetical protein